MAYREIAVSTDTPAEEIDAFLCAIELGIV